MSRKKDADDFLKVVEDCFVEAPALRKMPENFDILSRNYNRKFSSLPNANKEAEIDLDVRKKVHQRYKNKNPKLRSFILG